MFDRLIQTEWTRTKVELVVAGFVLVLGLTVLTVPIKKESTLTYDKGAITYTGTVVNYRMNGQGKLTYENGDTYEGQMKNGVFEGQGKFVSHQGWSYEGSFKGGQADGKGTLKAKGNKVYKGTFKQGIYQK